MNIKIGLILLWVCCWLSVKGQTYEASPSDFFFSTSAEDRAFMMAPSLISTGMDEVYATLSPSGDEFYYCIKSGPRQSVIVGIRFEDGFWTFPEVAPFSGKYTDLSPFVSPDNRYLYFVSDRPVNDSDELPDFNIWRCPRNPDGRWGNPELIAFSSNTGNEVSVSVDMAGNIFFSADYEKQSLTFDPSALDIYWVEKETDGSWSEIRKLGPSVNTDAIERTPAISPDGKTLVFSSSREEENSSADLYVSLLQNGEWRPAQKLSEQINSSAYEWCPAFSGNGQWLFFVSNLKREMPAVRDYSSLKKWLLGEGNGSFDIYYVKASAIPLQVNYNVSLD
ncbi:TolB family protein [Thermophagus sp. OGC60D27]|uniref:TolB family protein n=1 Tax=Thermophagus sp. OGC60D27 TaxID=3458415 RepID=UPI004037FB9C